MSHTDVLSMTSGEGDDNLEIVIYTYSVVLSMILREGEEIWRQ